MRMGRNQRRSVRFAGLAALVALGNAWCGASLAAPLADVTGAVVDYPSDPATVVVRYTERIGGIANTDTSSLTVYGDGRTVVHWPDYTKHHGDYELRLTKPEMDGILRSLVENRILSFDPDAVRRAKREAIAARSTAARARGGPEIVVASDDSTTTIEVNLDGSTAGAGNQRSLTRLHKTIAWYGLRTDARQHPEIDEIRNLSQVDEDLRALRARPDLSRIK